MVKILAPRNQERLVLVRLQRPHHRHPPLPPHPPRQQGRRERRQVAGRVRAGRLLHRHRPLGKVCVFSFIFFFSFSVLMRSFCVMFLYFRLLARAMGEGYTSRCDSLFVCLLCGVLVQRTRISCAPLTWMRQVRLSASAKHSRQKHSEAYRRKRIRSAMRRRNMC